MMIGKIIILSAPSGSGKSSIIRELMKDENLRLQFSISATSRKPRGEERNGVEYYFLEPDEFRARTQRNEFVEWEEVYAGTCYGTLRFEVERITKSGHNVIMDIDVMGAINVKREYANEALAIFILPPSKKELERRLRSRGTDSEEAIRKRLEKADLELSFAPQFDARVVNDDLHRAVAEVSSLINKLNG